MTRQESIKTLMQENIVLAVGCTEPVAVALAVAKAKEILGENVDRIEMYLSKNIIKNAMGVGIPGTGMIGLPIAISLGVVCGDSSKELQVLDNAKDNVNQAKEWLSTHEIKIDVAKTNEKLYIECRCYGNTNYSKVIIAQNHLNFIHIQEGENVILHKELERQETIQNNNNTFVVDTLCAQEIFDYATKTDINFLEWIYQTVEINDKIGQEGLTNDYGLGIGKQLNEIAEGDIRKKVIAKACAASDARMDGATLAVFSNSGSGNQGLTCTLPVYEYGRLTNKTKEEIIRALTLSHLMSIYIKNKIGRLSALCGIVNASMGAASGIILLKGGNIYQMCYAIRNMINTITGMACDGAKPSCALKVSAGLNSAFDSILLAMNNRVVDITDGIAEGCIDRSITNLGKIGRYAMDEMDNTILEIMLNKEK